MLHKCSTWESLSWIWVQKNIWNQNTRLFARKILNRICLQTAFLFPHKIQFLFPQQLNYKIKCFPTRKKKWVKTNMIIQLFQSLITILDNVCVHYKTNIDGFNPKNFCISKIGEHRHTKATWLQSLWLIIRLKIDRTSYLYLKRTLFLLVT